MATNTTSRVDPNELRNRFRAARRVPQLLEVRAAVAAAIRQTSEAMDGEEGGDSSAELNALFTQLKCPAGGNRRQTDAASHHR